MPPPENENKKCRRVNHAEDQHENVKKAQKKCSHRCEVLLVFWSALGGAPVTAVYCSDSSQLRMYIVLLLTTPTAVCVVCDRLPRAFLYYWLVVVV